MKYFLFIYITFLSVHLYATNLQGTWVIDGLRSCVSGTPINDFIKPDTLKKYEMTFTADEVNILTEVENIPQINNGQNCKFDVTYTYTVNAEQNGKDNKTLPTLSRKLKSSSSTCSNNSPGLPEVKINFLLLDGVLRLLEVVDATEQPCPVGDAIVSLYRRK